MSFVTILLTAIALSMDALAVSITKGITIKKVTKSVSLKIAIAFGFFQGFMPLLGWIMGIGFEKYIKSIDHWIALILLSILGIKMISEYIKSKKEEETQAELEISATNFDDDISNKELLMLAIATSIDALAVGISFAFLNVSIVEASIVIALVTFVICLVGVVVGNKVGDIFGGYAELAGGIILILIGLNIFNEHTQMLSQIINNIF